jgi:hypothetical protein
MGQASLTKKTQFISPSQVSRRLCAPDPQVSRRVCAPDRVPRPRPPLPRSAPTSLAFMCSTHVFMCSSGWSLGEENKQLANGRLLEPPRTTHLTSINRNRNTKIHNKLIEKHPPIENPCVFLLLVT